MRSKLYCGKQVPGPYEKSNKADDIVKRLVVPRENTKRNPTTDNYYTSRIFNKQRTYFTWYPKEE